MRSIDPKTGKIKLLTTGTFKVIATLPQNNKYKENILTSDEIKITLKILGISLKQKEINKLIRTWEETINVPAYINKP